MSSKNSQIAKTLVGCACALALVALAYFSLSPERELAVPVIAGIVLVIALLLGQLDELADLLESWRE